MTGAIDRCPAPADRSALELRGPRVAEIRRIAIGRKPVIEHLQPDGYHAPVEASRFLHITADEIHDRLTAQDNSREADWYRRLNERAMGRDRQA